jgi:hypothetical protein
MAFIDDNNYSNLTMSDEFLKNIRENRKDKDVLIKELKLKKGRFGFRSPNGTFISKGALASILEAYRQKKKREEEIKATLQVVKSQEAYNDLQKELISLQKQLASMQSDLLKKSNLSTEATQKLIVQINQNPNIEVSKQLETIDEIPKEVVEDAKKDEKIVEDIKTENGASDNKGGLPKWVLPTLIIGGIAYFLFRKK